MSCHTRFVYAAVGLIACVYLVRSEFAPRPCFSAVLDQCVVGETCEIQHNTNATEGGTPNGLCVCLKNHKRNKDGYCIPLKPHPQLPTPAKVNSDSKSSSSAGITAGILVPLLFVGLAVLVVLGRRNGWLDRLRQPRIRHYDTALVGGDLDDDPPIA